MFLTHYSNLLSKINLALHTFMDNHIEAVKGSPFLEFYYKKINDFLFTGGKRIRPILLVDSFLSVTPQKNVEKIIPTSLSLELLHNASLIHDDIMDKADIRRGEKTFHISLRDYANEKYSNTNSDDFGVSMGILGGDFTYNLAYKAINTTDFPPAVTLKAAIEFNEGFFQIVQGVIIETEFMGRFAVTEDEYYTMIKGKTAALFEKASRIGAIFAEGTESQINTLGEFGKTAGVAFQIVDDIIGTFGDPKKTGKPVDSDLKEGKKTILTIKAIEEANEEQRKILSKTIGNQAANEEEIEEVRDIIKETGALDYS
ncbi:MAG: polyprenyl synthetase family protein, partial [Candidatus Thorarchaeota archaeon]